jgi:hypothetical protein
MKLLQAKVVETNLRPVPLLNLNSGYITERPICFLVRGTKHHGVFTKNILDYKMLVWMPSKTNALAFSNNEGSRVPNRQKINYKDNQPINGV